ncbi:hypothetical protein DQ04_00431190 [Trypanosoma grayi]|uniref:hypothetical protein n=1 Tax=Trypanosoma grayi TaxID=71804 RepID=UPI0004F41E62|nr:hypothetical protein DQ04_00431190 [Trypanosoma grayi]KEG14515.1 hypothetical protein DQ04_00431190 [Trypanosoma grayi]
MKGVRALWNKLLSRSVSLTESGRNSLKEGLLSPPHSFDLHHELGSREFTLYTENLSGAEVLIHCSVDNRGLRSLNGGEKEKIRSQRAHFRTRLQNSTPRTSPVEVSAFVSVPHTAFTVEASCSCLLGLLVVDGVVIHSGCITESLVPRDGYSACEMVYHGPLLSQRALSESLINIRSGANPLDPYRQEQAFFFDRHVRPWSSRFTRFGHVPVHTVQPRFANAVCSFLERFDVDDEVAVFAERFAHVVQKREKEAWTGVLRRTIGDKTRRCLA